MICWNPSGFASIRILALEILEEIMHRGLRALVFALACCRPESWLFHSIEVLIQSGSKAVFTLIKASFRVKQSPALSDLSELQHVIIYGIFE